MHCSKRWAPGWVIASAGNAEETEPEELEVFLKLEVFQGFSTDILVIIWLKMS